jgi:hypothetical protein
MTNLLYSSPNQLYVNNNSLLKILLVQLSSNGDCLYVTAIARQIKEDYSNCHLTWAIGSIYSHILKGNPHVDEIWEIPLIGPQYIDCTWRLFHDQLNECQKENKYNLVFITQMQPCRFDGTIRSSTLSGYPHPIRGSISPILQLLLEEIQNVNQFIKTNKIDEANNVILIECSAKSNQSFIDVQYAIKIAEMITEVFRDFIVVLSSNIPVTSSNNRIVDGSVLSFRENAELTKYCSFLIGGSSGITWISTSNWAKSLPMIQLINPNALWFASVVYDHHYWGLSTDLIIEMVPCDPQEVFDCFEMIFRKNFESAKLKFHVDLKPNYKACKNFQYELMTNYKFKEVFANLTFIFKRNGCSLIVLFFLVTNIIKFFIKKITPPVILDFIKINLIIKYIFFLRACVLNAKNKYP